MINHVLTRLVARQLTQKQTLSSSSMRRYVMALSPDLSALTKHQKLYWQKIPRWKDVGKEDFLSYKWQTQNSVQNALQLYEFLASVLPSQVSISDHATATKPDDIPTVSNFIADVKKGIGRAPMSIRLTPHILSLIDWQRPFEDPLRRQFIPLGSTAQEDHPELALDSLHETADSPVKGLVHRYPDKALFLGQFRTLTYDDYTDLRAIVSSVCPVYCRFCTRSYSVGVETETVSKKRFLPIQKRWEKVFEYIEQTPHLQDIVVSGGDTFSIESDRLLEIGNRLLSIPHILRIRFASKGLAVCPSRFLDPLDRWTEALIQVSNQGREMGKSVALHTHFNHPNEITWITALAAQRLFKAAVTVRNQTVLLKGVNNDLDTMQQLIRQLAELNIEPYYVYQGDMVRSLEDLRTPLHEILQLESQIRGTIAGFMTPSFIVDLPGGGGKRLAGSFETYDRATGKATFRAPGVTGADQVHTYYDPLWSLPSASP